MPITRSYVKEGTYRREVVQDPVYKQPRSISVEY